MKIKTKLRLGVGLLFLLIILLSASGTWYINALKKDTENILAANYNTLAYARQMLIGLDGIPVQPGAPKEFNDYLKRQAGNVTEHGEKEATALLKEHFGNLLRHPDDQEQHLLVRKDILDIMHLNMEAIARKSGIASATAEKSIIWIGITGTLCFLIAFTLLVNLPGNIANPIRELTESIREIAAQNYRQRVHFESHSEFGELARSFNVMASKLEEYAGSSLSRILMEKKRIETLINNMHDPVIGLDAQQKVLFANDEALKVLGLRMGDMIDKSLAVIALQNDLVRTLANDLVSPNKQNGKTEAIKIFADGKESFFEKEVVDIRIVPTGEDDVQFIGQVILLRNITPFKELDLAKTYFIATVSHELKTPIASLKMSLQLLGNEKTGALNQEQRHLLDSMGDDIDRLLRITGELLNMSQVETGNIQLNLRQSDPLEILRYAMEAVQTAANDKLLTFHAELPKQPPKVKADPEKTAWVLTNFLSNAIRYSPEQGVITVSVQEQKGYLEFSVKDNGKGIEERYRQRIFERYFQIPGSSKMGSGLGLAISKEFIEAMDGEIGVESQSGFGSRFYFRLPV